MWSAASGEVRKLRARREGAVWCKMRTASTPFAARSNKHNRLDVRKGVGRLAAIYHAADEVYLPLQNVRVGVNHADRRHRVFVEQQGFHASLAGGHLHHERLRCLEQVHGLLLILSFNYVALGHTGQSLGHGANRPAEGSVPLVQRNFVQIMQCFSLCCMSLTDSECVTIEKVKIPHYAVSQTGNAMQLGSKLCLNLAS